MGRLGDKRFGDEGGTREQLWQRQGLIVQEVYMSEESEERVTVLRQGEAPGVRAAKSSEFGGKVVSTLDGLIWSKCSIALTCPTRSHFQRTQSKERWGQGLDECYRSSREGEE